MYNSGNRRTTGKEQFYTRSNIADQCVNELLSIIQVRNSFTYLEPAGGTGRFIDALYRQGITKVISYDIEPKHKNVKKKSFFDLTTVQKPFICISNPPFGRANSLSKKFFNHAAELGSEYIAFLIPKSWRKWSIQNSLDRRYKLIKDIDLPNEAFETENGTPIKNSGGLKCIFQVWKRYKKQLRPIIKVQDRGYIEKCHPKDADVALTIFGWGAGTVETNFKRVKNTTKIYLKVLDEEIITALQQIDYSRFYCNVAYIPALSLYEINYLLNEHFDILALQK